MFELKKIKIKKKNSFTYKICYNVNNKRVKEVLLDLNFLMFLKQIFQIPSSVAWHPRGTVAFVASSRGDIQV